MSRRFIQEEISPINPSIQAILNNAMRNRRPHQASVIRVDPVNPQGQTPGNSILAGPSVPADPAQVSSSPSTSSVIGLDPANPQVQTPGNSIIAGPSAPADPAQVSSSPSTSSTSVIGVDPANTKSHTPGNSIIAGSSAPADPAQVSTSFSKLSTSVIEIVLLGVFIVGVFVGAVSEIIRTFWKAIPGNSRTSVIGVDPVNPQGQTPGNSIIAAPSAPADPAQVSSSPSTSSSTSVTVFAIFVILGVLFVREPKIIFKAMVIIIVTMIIVAVFVGFVSEIIHTFWKAIPGNSTTSVIGVDPAKPQGQRPGNLIIAGPSAPADPAQVSSSPFTSSASAQALPQAGWMSRISSSVSIGQDQAFDEAEAAPIK